jgi:DNA-binding MarR family transcriptional regulator
MAPVAQSASAAMPSAAADPAAQVDYASLPEHVGYLLRLAQLRVWEDFYARLGETGITPSLYSALVLIERNPGLQQSRLGEALGVARSGAMTMVDRLERQNLVERRPAPHDRRAYGLFLTGEGRRRMPDIVAMVRQHDRQINAVLSAAEHRTLMDLLKKFVTAPAQRGGSLPAKEGDPVASRQNRSASRATRNGRR